MRKLVKYFVASILFFSCSLMVSANNLPVYSSDEFEIKLLKCIGNSSAQLVKMEFVFTHQLSNRDVHFDGEGAYDEEGNSYVMDVYGSKNLVDNIFYIPYHQARKIKVDVKSVLPTVEKLSSVVLKIYFPIPDGRSIEVTLRDIPITWKY